MKITLFKNSKNPIKIFSAKAFEEEIQKWMGHREALVAMAIGLYLKGEQHREFSPSIKKLMEDFHIKEAVDTYQANKNN